MLLLKMTSVKNVILFKQFSWNNINQSRYFLKVKSNQIYYNSLIECEITYQGVQSNKKSYISSSILPSITIYSQIKHDLLTEMTIYHEHDSHTLFLKQQNTTLHSNRKLNQIKRKIQTINQY